ncbi:carbohydrate ABC transporter permease [Paenibacillus filicis]|uniref:Carbohydrate ABC transporter permease n=1 Tax=Paenibacillus filicis TaxID=669464 RepID=A0ABU9DMI0_9BACL
MSVQAVSAVPQRSVKAASRRKPLRWLPYVVLSLGGVLMIFPFLWMISTSLKEPKDLFTLSLFSTTLTWNNYIEVFTKSPFSTWLLNSLIVAAVTTISVCFFDSIIGYVLAKFNFRGKKIIFVGILSTLMVPTEMLIIPWYILSVTFDWVDTYWGIMFPGLISAFGIFLMKQFMESVPEDLLDAARMDGMSEWGILFKIAVPLVQPALATLFILSFLGNWNAFIWPLIVSMTEERMTVPVGLSFFSSELKDSAGWVLIMTGATVSVIPLIVIFLIFQKQIIRGVALTGLK